MKVIELINKEFLDMIFSDFDLGAYSDDVVIECAAIGIDLDLQMGFNFLKMRQNTRMPLYIHSVLG
ncbi:MAG: hypothetical protein RL571_225 [Pseudomonadota bacterium]|jgi:hypothetical protein